MCRMYIVPDIIIRYNIITNVLKGGLSVPASKAQQKAVNKYMKENYDEIKVRTEKGKKGTIKAHAEARGESVNGFINRAIDETMERDKSATEGR